MMTDEFLDKLLERLHRLHEIRGHIAALDAADAICELRDKVRQLRIIANVNGDWNIKYGHEVDRANRAERERDELRQERYALAAWQTRHLALHDERSRSQQVNDGI